MLALGDFTPEQREWFESEFLSGRRHFADASYPGYLISIFGTPVSNSETEVMTHMSYLVIDAVGDIWPVVPDLNNLGSGSVTTHNGQESISFLSRPLIETIPSVFPNAPFAITAWATPGGESRGMYFDLEDIPKDIPSVVAHAVLTTHSISMLTSDSSDAKLPEQMSGEEPDAPQIFAPDNVVDLAVNETTAIRPPHFPYVNLHKPGRSGARHDQTSGQDSNGEHFETLSEDMGTGGSGMSEPVSDETPGGSSEDHRDPDLFDEFGVPFDEWSGYHQDKE